MSDPSDMCLLAAGFLSETDAEATETDLRAMLDVDEGDISIERIGGDDAARYAVVLAGRFREGRLDAVHEVIAQHAGEELTEIPEWLA